MRCTLAIALVLVAAVSAQLEGLPECVRKCATDAIDATPACTSIPMLECICTKDEFRAAVRPCLAACPPDDLTTALEAKANACSGATASGAEGSAPSGGSTPRPSGTQSSVAPSDAAARLGVGFAAVIAAAGLTAAL